MILEVHRSWRLGQNLSHRPTTPKLQHPILETCCAWPTWKSTQVAHNQDVKTWLLTAPLQPEIMQSHIIIISLTPDYLNPPPALSSNLSLFWCAQKCKWQGSVHPAPVPAPSLLVWSCVTCCSCQPNFHWSYIVSHAELMRIHFEHMNIKSNIYKCYKFSWNILDRPATTSPWNSTAIAVKIKTQELPVLHCSLWNNSLSSQFLPPWTWRFTLI